MHVVDIRTVCICEEISYVPIWKECIKIKTCLHKCIFVKKQCEENKIYRNNNWYTRETDYTSYLPDNVFTIEYNYAWFRHMHTCTSQQLSLLTKNWVRQRSVHSNINEILLFPNVCQQRIYVKIAIDKRLSLVILTHIRYWQTFVNSDFNVYSLLTNVCQ